MNILEGTRGCWELHEPYEVPLRGLIVKGFANLYGRKLRGEF